MADEGGAQDGGGAPPIPRVRGSAPKAYVAARALRWRVGKAPQGGVQHAEAMRFLERLAEQLSTEQGTAIKSMISDGRVRARRLAPVDGVMWRLPGARVFAIQGMQPFIVPDPKPADQSAESRTEPEGGDSADPLEAAAEAEDPSSPS